MDELDLSAVRRIPFAERQTKVAVADFGRDTLAEEGFAAFFEGLPRFLAAEGFRRGVERTRALLRAERGVHVLMGAHLIKTGVSPLLCGLLRRGAIACLSMNGAAVIHDVEIALFGRTSEDVADTLQSGLFGYVEEPAQLIHEALRRGAARGWGYGEAVARCLAEQKPPHAAVSLLLTAWEAGVPLTVHSALGTETIHQHPEADGAAAGVTGMRDFRRLGYQLTRLGGGMLHLYGSAVIMPEVFLKALTVARNLGHAVRGFTAINFDMIDHYRPRENVIRRPTLGGGDGITLIGHHELMLPLFWQAVYAAGDPAARLAARPAADLE